MKGAEKYRVPVPVAMAGEELFISTSNDGTRIAAWRSGHGPPLVLVHGSTADHTRWRPLLPTLETNFTVYAMDRRGRGASGDADDYAIGREFEDVAAVVNGIDGPVNLLGHSYGALCSLEASLRTQNLSKLILYEPPIPVGAPMYPPGARERFEALLAAGDREALLAAFMRDIAGLSDRELNLVRSLPAWQARLAAAHTIPREFADADYKFDPARFRSMSTPTLVLKGSESAPFLQAAADVVARNLPNPREVVLEGHGHAAMDTGRQLFTQVVLQFLEEPTSRSGGTP